MKKEVIPIEKVCINLREGDWEWLKTHGNRKAGVTVRRLVAKYRNAVEKIVEKNAPSIHSLEIELEDILND